jgi:hypothetical protein
MCSSLYQQLYRNIKWSCLIKCTAHLSFSVMSSAYESDHPKTVKISRSTRNDQTMCPSFYSGCKPSAVTNTYTNLRTKHVTREQCALHCAATEGTLFWQYLHSDSKLTSISAAFVSKLLFTPACIKTFVSRRL